MRLFCLLEIWQQKLCCAAKAQDLKWAIGALRFTACGALRFAAYGVNLFQSEISLSLFLLLNAGIVFKINSEGRSRGIVCEQGLRAMHCESVSVQNFYRSRLAEL